jgi:hypothetical protein
MSSTAFITLRQRVMDMIYAGQFPIRGTATGGTTATVVDSGAALSGATADAFDHFWVKVATSTDNLAPQGEIRQISEAGFGPTTGTFTVPSVFTAAPAAGDTYEIHRMFHPSELDLIINEFLRQLWVPRFFPLSAHIVANDDNDMEYADATSWSEVGGGSLAKSTSIYNNGLRGLTFTTSVADEYVTCTSMDIQTKLQYATAVSLSLTTGTAHLTIFDGEQSVVHKTSGEGNHLDWQQFFVEWTPDDGMLYMQPRFVATTGDDFTIDDYHTWVVGPYGYATPSWISMRQQIIDVVGIPMGQSIATDVYAMREHAGIPLRWKFEQEEWNANNEIRIHVDVPGNMRPYIKARNPITAVAFDYGTAGVGAGALGSPANTVPLSSQQADMVVDGVYGELCRRLAFRSDGQQRDDYLRTAETYAQKYRAWAKQFGLADPVTRYTQQRVGAVMR